MKITIFYSWQSSVPSKCNRNFIQKALEKATRDIGVQSRIDEPTRQDHIEIDSDTRGEPGSVEVFNVIKEKISNCSIFVPDFTIVGESRPDENGQSQLISNPNVLIEYGYALNAVGLRRMIAIMNAFYGEPGKFGENLPFNMRHVRHPITYNLAPDADPETRTKAANNLCMELKGAIETIIKKELRQGRHSQIDFFGGTPPPNPDDPSIFFEPGESFDIEHSIHRPPSQKYLPDGPRIFLHVIPQTPLDPPLSSLDAKQEIQNANLFPMQAQPDNSHCYGRNRFGGFSISFADEDIKDLTQLLSTGELWGINTFLRDTIQEVDPDSVNPDAFGNIPIEFLERIFVFTLANYVKFLSDTLKLRFPIRLRAGIVGVKGYSLAPPNGYYKGFAKYSTGRMVQDAICYPGEISDASADPDRLLSPFFEKIWEECGERKSSG